MAFRLYSPLQLVYTSRRNALKDNEIISALIYVLTYVHASKARPEKARTNGNLFKHKPMALISVPHTE